MPNIETLTAEARTVRGVAFDDFQPGYTSLGDLVHERFIASRDDPWLTWYDSTDETDRWTYSEFVRLVDATARMLLNHGVTRGSRIATVSTNHWETVVQYFAAWWLGASVVPINVGEDDDRIEYILSNARPKLAFVREPHLDRIAGIRHRLSHQMTLVLCGAGSSTAPETKPDDIYTPSPPESSSDLFTIPRRYLLDDECLIVYTSGTTGPPKGVVLTHGNLLADAIGISEWHGVTSDTRMMCVLPIHHVNGTVVTLVTPFFAGGSVVLNQRFQTNRFFQRAIDENVQIVSVVPTLLAYLCNAETIPESSALEGFRHIICGAGPLTCELAEKFESLYGVPIIHGYGLSETTCYSCFLPTDLPVEDHRSWMLDHGFPSIGVPIPQNEMAIHDAEGRSVDEGDKGEIVIRGHNVMKGYFANPEANEKAFAHGWFRSGDEGFVKRDDQGREFYFITGRLKELIIRGGVNISPLEIDEVLNTCPDVSAGIAVGFENSWYGEEIGAFVVKGDNGLTEKDVIAYCAERLPFSKRPKVVKFGDELPVTSTGKYQRNRLKDQFAEFKETQFRES